MLGMCFLPRLYVATDGFCYRPWHALPMLAGFVASWSALLGHHFCHHFLHRLSKLLVRTDAALALFSSDRGYHVEHRGVR